MLVDDDQFQRTYLSDVLQEMGFDKVHCCHSGKEALTVLLTQKPQPALLICDLHMPGGKDGFQVMEELAEMQYGGAVVLVSGQQSHVLHAGTLMARFHQLNFLGQLEKPVVPARLAELLRAIP